MKKYFNLLSVKFNIFYIGLFFSSFFLVYSSFFLKISKFDVYYNFSQIIFYLGFSFIFLSKFFRNLKYLYIFQVLTIALLSCSSLSLLLITIQDNFLFTRWLEFGLFPSNDAQDYVQQSINYLYENEFYSAKGRVMFPILYSGLLGFFKLDTMLIQITITLLSSFITMYCSLLIMKNYGYFFAVIFSLLSADFLHEHIAGVCTENIGYIIGGCSFIFFNNFYNSKNKSLYFYFISLFLLLIAYIIRPSIVFVLPAIIVFSLIIILKVSNIKALKLLFITVFTIFTVINLNTFLLETKSPESPKGFSNAYDSWYATGQLGKYILNNNYENLPKQLWSQIFVDNPGLIELKGEDARKSKVTILKDSILNNPENYLVGSTIQILKFFHINHIFNERYHNTAGFLHLEFDILRASVLFLFLFGGIFSIISWFKNKNDSCLFFSLLFIAVVFSQPFIYGGEARTSSTVIFFINFMLIFSLHSFIELIRKSFYKKHMKQSFEKSNQICLLFSSISLLPSIILGCFFLLGFANQFNYLSKFSNDINLVCDSGKKLRNFQFNSNSGIHVDSEENNFNFEKILNSYVDKIAIIKLYPNIKPVKLNMEDNDFENRDSLKFINKFSKLTNTRLFSLSERELSLLKSLGLTSMSDGGFYITPNSVGTKSLNSLVILKKEMVREGFNNIYVCL